MRNFGYVLDGLLAGLAHPGSGEEADGVLDELSGMGFRAVVSLDEVGVDPNLVRDHGMAHLHLPVTDFEPPTVEQGVEFVEFVSASLGRGEPVVVHCQAGIGRTGTMLASYLVAAGLSPTEAAQAVRKARPMSIESESQRRFLDDLAAHLMVYPVRIAPLADL